MIAFLNCYMVVKYLPERYIARLDKVNLILGPLVELTFDELPLNL